MAPAVPTPQLPADACSLMLHGIDPYTSREGTKVSPPTGYGTMSDGTAPSLLGTSQQSLDPFRPRPLTPPPLELHTTHPLSVPATRAIAPEPTVLPDIASERQHYAELLRNRYGLTAAPNLSAAELRSIYARLSGENQDVDRSPAGSRGRDASLPGIRQPTTSSGSHICPHCNTVKHKQGSRRFDRFQGLGNASVAFDCAPYHRNRTAKLLARRGVSAALTLREAASLPDTRPRSAFGRS